MRTRVSLALLLLFSGRAAAAEKELTVMLFSPTVLGEAWETTLELIDEFERENPGVSVRLLPEPATDYLTKLKIMLAARQPLDVAMIDVTEFSSFLKDGALLDLQPHFDRDAAWKPDDYFAVTLDGFRDGAGHLYGLPSTFTPYVMYFNKDIFDREGLAYPRADWTWSEFLEIARRCTRRPQQFGVSITQWLQALSPWVWQNGGSFLSPDGTRATVNRPETVAAFRFLRDLFHKERVASTDATYEGQLTRSRFEDGRVALYGPVGYWEVYRFKDITEFRWDVRPLPRGKRAATSIAMRSYVAFRHTRHPELAYRFLRKLAGKKLAHTLARIGNGVPGFKEAAYSEDFLKPDVAPDSEHVFLDVLKHARFQPVFANWREIESLVADELQGCLVFGKYDAETACRRMAEKIEGYLERGREEERRPKLSIVWVAVATGFLCLLAVLLFWRLRGRAPVGLARGEERAAHGCVALWAIGFLIFTLGPMVASAGISLTHWSPLKPAGEARWAGLQNYARMLDDPELAQALSVTLLYTLFSVPLTLALALGLAVLVRRGRQVFRAIFYLPLIASAVATGIIWRWLFDSAWLEMLLGARWSESEPWILPGFVFMSLWTVGGPMLIFLAALQGIDPQLYEAARLDGASRWRQFRHVTLPQLTPVLLFNLIIGIINAFQTFAQPFVMTNGGPGNASLFYVLYLFRTAFRHHHMGYASALGWVLCLILLLCTVLLLKSSRRWVHYEGAGA